MFKLTELNAKFFGLNNWAAPDRPFYVGLSFDCPCEKCRKEPCPHCGHKENVRRLAVNFWPPIDPTQVQSLFAVPYSRKNNERVCGTSIIFDRTGDQLDTLTLEQPISVVGHWHGRIVDGCLIEDSV